IVAVVQHVRRVQQEGQHAPVDAVGAVALGGVLAGEVGRAAQHPLAAGGLLARRAVAGLVGEDGRADVGGRRVNGVAQLTQCGVDRGHLGGQFTAAAGGVQRLHGFGGGHIGRVLAGEGELRQTQGVGAEGGSLARGDQFVGGGHRVGDVADDLHQQVVAEGGLFGPVLDVGAELEPVVRLGAAPAVVNALFVHALVKVVGRGGGLPVADLAGGGQVAAVGGGGRDGTGVHQGHGADLALAGLGAFPVGEVAGGVADAELAVGRGVARAE